ERKGREKAAARLRDQHLLFELDPFATPLLADIAFDADRHPRLKLAVVGTLLPILDMGDLGPLVAEPDAVRHAGIAVPHEGVRDAPRELARLAKIETGLHQLVDVVMDLFHRQAVDAPLFGARLAGAAEICARDVGAIAERPDEVGIETHEVARPAQAVAAFLEPGVRAFAGREDARFDPLAAKAYV